MQSEERDLDKAFWSLPPAELMTRLGTGASGLSSGEAVRRIRRYGPNAVEGRAQLSAVWLLMRQFESPLVLILVFGAIVSLTLREWIDAAIILGIVLGSTLLGFFQEYRASAAIAKLQNRLTLKCRVVRDGTERILPTRELVPGDLVLLSAGNLVPADGFIVDAEDFLVVEASLTGESFPVEKRPGALPSETPLSGRTNAVFLGCSVRSGTAKVVVVETGARTVFGTVAARLKQREPETDFARGIRQFGSMLVRVMILIVVFVLIINQLLGRPVLESLLFAVALAVGMSPELLPAIVSVTLSAGARAMAKRGVIIRHLEAIESLGSMDVLCTDKTGTLTEGSLVLSDAVDPSGRTSEKVRQLAFFNAALETGIENPLDAAIVASGRQNGLEIAEDRKIDEIPYDFRRKRLTVVIAHDGDPTRHLMITKGAFSHVLSICPHLEQDGVVISLDEPARNRLDAFYRLEGDRGARVLAVASKVTEAKARYGRDDEKGMVFLGFLLFLDPPKPQARATIRDLAALGISIKVISGDNRYVTAHLAEAVGLDPRSMLTGEDLAHLRDEALWHLAERTTLFVEVDPQQKERVVRALQRTGHGVGYLGDGINDAPALYAADVGISVDQAVDVARESADIVLLERDLDVLCQGVRDGRRTFANTLKYIRITTSANFGNMISMAIATPLLPFLPLSAKQILLNNFLSDLPSIFISTDNVDAASVARAPHWDIRDIRRFMLVFGLISSVFDMLTFGVLLQVYRADEATFQTAWFIVSLLTELAVVLVLRTSRPALRSPPRWLLAGMTLAVGGVALLLPYLGQPVAVFGFVPLPGPIMGSMVILVVAYIATTEVAKRWFFRTGSGHAPSASGRSRHRPGG
jgi:P-type Mg2+ transporter